MRGSTTKAAAAITALIAGLGTSAAVSGARAASAMGMNGHGYVQHNLVSDDTSKIPADHEDATLLNP